MKCPKCGYIITGRSLTEEEEYKSLIVIAEKKMLTNKEYERFNFLRSKEAAMKFCPLCGIELVDISLTDEKLYGCPHCGAEIEVSKNTYYETAFTVRLIKKRNIEKTKIEKLERS